MKFYELIATIFLKKDTHFSQSSELIGKNISNLMLNDNDLRKYHKEKIYKYVFTNLYPVEKDGVYKKDRVYILNLRCFNENYILKIKKCMENYESSDLRIISADIKEINQKHINFLETITPAIVTIDSKPWLPNEDILLLVKRLHANAEKKFKFFFNEEIGEVEDYFIEKLKILNRKPTYYSYKGIKLLSNKFKIKVNDDDKSQKLAFIVLGGGLAEKNSILGAGYCKCDWR